MRHKGCRWSSEQDPVVAIRELTRNGEGADKSIECSANTVVRRQAIQTLRRWGTAGMVGVFGKVEFDSEELIQLQKTVVGSLTFSKNQQEECAQFVAERGLDVESLFTNEFRLDEAEKAYELFDQRKIGKASSFSTDGSQRSLERKAMTTTQPDFVLNEQAQSFLSRDVHHLFIDGQGVPAASGQTLTTTNPSTGEVLARFASGGQADVDRAVLAARKAFKGQWSTWTPYERQALLTRIAQVLDQRFEELIQIEALDMGDPVSRLRNSKASLMKMLAFFASQAMSISGETLMNGVPGNVTTMTLKAPVGVIGGTIPWNGPLNSQFWIIGAVLASGCTAVLKPASEASLSVLRVAEILQEAGVPARVINVVTGSGREAGNALAAHPDVDRIAHRID